METKLPKSIEDFQKRYPKIWEAFDRLGEQCHENGGPLDERTRRLVKLGISMGSQHEGAVHSAVRNALAAGLTAEEIQHVAILAITTIGWPAAYAALRWADETIADSA